MFKYLLSAIIIAFFTACSAPKPETKPSWYTTLPKDFNFFYATGADKNIDKAKKKAVASLRQQINEELNNNFKNGKTKLYIESNQNIDAILMANEYLVNTMSMRAVQLDKSAIYKQDTLVLIKLPRKTIFDLVSRTAIKKLNSSKEQFNSVQNQIAIKKFIVVSELMKDYPKLASLVEAKKVTLHSYNTSDEFSYLNDLRAAHLKLKKDISFYVLSDVNSRIFAPSIKDAIRSEGLRLSSKPTGKDALKLFITSKTTESQNYSFNQSKSLIKFSTYDLNKNKVSFKQHTFIGKSRKNHKEAKEQSALNVKAKVTKIGVFSFLGLN